MTASASATSIESDSGKSRWLTGVVAVALAIAYAASFDLGEPVYLGDENRHVMTAVYFHDLLTDHPTSGFKTHAKQFYAQYPALGLMIWPPLFHGICGTLMLGLGTSFVVAKLLVMAFAAVAAMYLFLLVRRTHGTTIAAGTTLLFGLAPLVFVFSQHVMLEMPTVAFSLATLFHFTRFLDESRRRDLFLAALTAAGAALARFDAAYLLPLLLGLIAVRKRWDVLARWDTWVAGVAAVVLVLPYYALVFKEAGGLHARQASQSLMPEDQAMGAWRHLAYYPSQLPLQIGWPMLVAAGIGLLALADRERRRQFVPYACLIGATYLTFSPLAELTPRHTIYWIPAFALLAMQGVALALRRIHSPAAVLGVAALLAAAGPIQEVSDPSASLHGYDAAARYVVEHSQSPAVLFDGWLDGNFTYHIRRNDPERSRVVLRGDKLLYTFLCVPETDYQELARTEGQVLETIEKYDPEYIVVEEPLAMRSIAGSDRLRKVLADHPERFALEQTIPVTGTAGAFREYKLKIYRVLMRGDAPSRADLVRMLTESEGSTALGQN